MEERICGRCFAFLDDGDDNLENFENGYAPLYLNLNLLFLFNPAIKAFKNLFMVHGINIWRFNT